MASVASGRDDGVSLLMAMETSGDERRPAPKRSIKRPDPAEIVAFFSRKRKKDNDLRLARAQANFEEVAKLLSQAFEAAKSTSVEAAEWISARMESVLSGIQAEIDEDREGSGSESPGRMNQASQGFPPGCCTRRDLTANGETRPLNSLLTADVFHRGANLPSFKL